MLMNTPTSVGTFARVVRPSISGRGDAVLRLHRVELTALVTSYFTDLKISEMKNKTSYSVGRTSRAEAAECCSHIDASAL